MACNGERCWQVYQDRVTVGPAEEPPTGIAELLDPSWLLGCRLSGGIPVLAGDRQADRINVARGAASSSLSLPSLFPAAVAVVDAGTGLEIRLTSDIGDRPVRRNECATSPPWRRPHHRHPPDLPVTEDLGPGADGSPPGGPYRVAFPWRTAGAAAAQDVADVAKGVAKEAAKAAGNFLRRLSDR